MSCRKAVHRLRNIEVYKEAHVQSKLLTDLLHFDGLSELLAEGKVGDGDVLQGDVELC